MLNYWRVTTIGRLGKDVTERCGARGWGYCVMGRTSCKDGANLHTMGYDITHTYGELYLNY